MVPALVRACGLVVVALSLVPALAWSPRERARLRWPWLPLVEAGALLVVGLGLAAFGKVLAALPT